MSKFLSISRATAPLAVFAALLTASGCTCSRDPYAGSLADNVGATFADCNEAEIRFLAAKHNVQLTFAPCGSNNFSAFRWSPNGLHVYFQLVMSANVMNADARDKRTITLPIPQPTGMPAWVTSTRLVIPVVGDDDAPAMTVFELPNTDEEAVTTVSGLLSTHPLPGLVDADQLQRGDSPAEVLFAGRATADGDWKLYRFDVSEGTYAVAFPWLDAPVDTFTYTPSQHALLVGVGDEVTAYDTTTGEEVYTYAHATRGSLSPDGSWVALELGGEAVSVFGQRTWDEVSDQARRREQARADAFADRLPDAFERTVRPPMLSFTKPGTDARYTITAFQGDHFQWYEAAPGWGSFFLWGFESKQYKRNVALANLRGHLESIAAGEARYGIVPFVAPGTAPPEPSDPAPQAGGTEATD